MPRSFVGGLIYQKVVPSGAVKAGMPGCRAPPLARSYRGYFRPGAGPGSGLDGGLAGAKGESRTWRRLWWWASQAPGSRQPTSTILKNIGTKNLPISTKLLGTMLSVTSSSTAAKRLIAASYTTLFLAFLILAFFFCQSHDSLHEFTRIYASLRLLYILSHAYRSTYIDHRQPRRPALPASRIENHSRPFVSPLYGIWPCRW